MGLMRVNAAVLICAAVLPSAVGFINIPGSTVPSLRAFGRGATCAVPRPPTLARAHGLRSQSSAGLGKDGAPNARPPVVASVLCVFALPLCMPGDFRAARGGGVFRYVSCCRAAAVGQAAPTAGPCL